MVAKVINKIDYGKFLLQKLFAQYNTSEKFTTLHYQTGEIILDDVEDNIFDIINMCDIDNATGNSLDAAASLIGLGRMSIQIPAVVWTLDQTPFTNYPFGDENYIDWEICPDDVFRECIKSYAITQTAHGSMPEILETVSLLLGIEIADITVAKPGLRQWTFTIPAGVSVGLKYLLGIGANDYRAPNGGFLWAKPAGITINFVFLT